LRPADVQKNMEEGRTTEQVSPVAPARRCRPSRSTTPTSRILQSPTSTERPPLGGRRFLVAVRALGLIAVTQGRSYAPARAYLERKQSEGKSRREAIRCLIRQLARTVYTTLVTEPPWT
jgi:transposase